jgi:large subunit ribosomal protein L39e
VAFYEYIKIDHINKLIDVVHIMTRNKPLGKKIRLMKEIKRNRRVPAWVMMRTKRKFSQHPKRHNWRRSKFRK